MVKKMTFCLIAALLAMVCFMLPSNAFDANDYGGGDYGGGYDGGGDYDWGDYGGYYGGGNVNGVMLIVSLIPIILINRKWLLRILAIIYDKTKKDAGRQTGAFRNDTIDEGVKTDRLQEIKSESGDMRESKKYAREFPSWWESFWWEPLLALVWYYLINLMESQNEEIEPFIIFALVLLGLSVAINAIHKIMEKQNIKNQTTRKRYSLDSDNLITFSAFFIAGALVKYSVDIEKTNGNLYCEFEIDAGDKLYETLRSKGIAADPADQATPDRRLASALKKYKNEYGMGEFLKLLNIDSDGIKNSSGEKK